MHIFMKVHLASIPGLERPPESPHRYTGHEILPRNDCRYASALVIIRDKSDESSAEENTN